MKQPLTLKPKNRDQLKQIIEQRINEQGPNCDLNDIDVSGITNMSCLFKLSQFNGDISKWDVQNNTNTQFIFYLSPLYNNPPQWY